MSKFIHSNYLISMCLNTNIFMHLILIFILKSKIEIVLIVI